MREFNAALIQKAVQGDQDAIGELYRLTYSNVYHTVKSMILDEDTVLDVVQDTYLKAFDSLDQLDTPEHFKAWIKRIATNKAKDYLKRKRPILFSEMAAEDGTEVEFEDECVGHLPEEVLDRKETIRLMDEILSTLSEDQQLAIGMFYFEQMSITEIAAALGCSENTVKSRLNYGRKKVKVKVEELEKKGTKLYSLAPLPFFLWLLKSMDAATEIPSADILENITAQYAVGAAPVKAAKGGKYSGKYAQGTGTAKAAAGGAAKATAGGAAKAVGVKIAAGVLAVAIAGGGAIAWAGSQKDEQPGTPSFVATEEVSLSATEVAEPQVTEQAEAAVSPDTAYQGIVSQYVGVLGANSQDFLNNPDNYYNGDHALVHYYHTYPGMQFQYAYYDINKDGTNELLIGADGIISDVYGFDGANAVQLLDEPSMGDRSQLTIHQDGTLALVGSSGADSTSYDYWQLNGTVLNAASPSNSEAVSDFNWQPIEANQQAPAASASADEAYQTVLNQYLDAMEIDHQAFVDAFSSGDYGAYFAADEDAMVGYHLSFLRDFGLDVLYAYYDIDHNGTNELLISSLEDGGGSYEISAVYGFNGSEAVRLLRNPVELDSRAHLYINQDGTMETTYNDMETGSLKRKVWQLTGYTLEETGPSGAEGVWEFDWLLLRAGQSSDSVGIDYYIGTFMNGNGLQATTLTIEKQGDNLARVSAVGLAEDFGMETLFEATAWVEPHGLVVSFDTGGIAIFEEADGGFRLMPEDALRDIMGFDPAVHDVFDSTYFRFDTFGPYA